MRYYKNDNLLIDKTAATGGFLGLRMHIGRSLETVDPNFESSFVER